MNTLTSNERSEIEQLRAALKVARQALIETIHAQECGPSWYTRGESGMYAQVRMWTRRGTEAIAAALGPYDENGEYEKEKASPETFERREMEILRAELAGARARVDWYVKLLCRFWNVLPPDVKAPDGRMMRFVHPDPQTALRFVQEAMDEAQRQVEVEHAQKAGEPGL